MGVRQAHKLLTAFEIAALSLAALGWRDKQAKLPRPRRFAGIFLAYAILGLTAETGQGPARVSAALGGLLALTVALNRVVSGRLLRFLGDLAGYFGQPPHAESPGQPQLDSFIAAVTGTSSSPSRPRRADI
jgi:hypothetical protein